MKEVDEMLLGSRIKVRVFSKEGKYLKTIQRCFRAFLGKYVVLYENNKYEVKGDGNLNPWCIYLR